MRQGRGKQLNSIYQCAGRQLKILYDVLSSDSGAWIYISQLYSTIYNIQTMVLQTAGGDSCRSLPPTEHDLPHATVHHTYPVQSHINCVLLYHTLASQLIATTNT